MDNNDNFGFGDGFLGDFGGNDDSSGNFSGTGINDQQNDYSGNTYGGQQNDYNSMNGMQNDYSGNTYGGQQNDYNSMNGMQNDYSGNTYGGQQNDYNSMNGMQNDYSGNTYGGQQNDYNSMNGMPNGYDPNAMFSDPSSSMYGNSGYNPNSSYSSLNTQTQYGTATKTGISKYIPVIAIILALAVGIGVFFYVKNAGQRTVKEWLDTPEGKAAVNEMYRTGINNSSFTEDDVQVFARGDDELVFSFRIQEFTYIPQEEADQLQKYMEQALSSRKSLLANEIKKLRNGYKLKPFSVVYEMVTASDQLVFSVKISE